jgi:hypothetical protein
LFHFPLPYLRISSHNHSYVFKHVLSVLFMFFRRSNGHTSIILKSEVKTRYCLSIVSEGSRQVKTICGDNLENIVNSALNLDKVDIYIHTIPSITKDRVSVRL